MLNYTLIPSLILFHKSASRTEPVILKQMVMFRVPEVIFWRKYPILPMALPPYPFSFRVSYVWTSKAKMGLRVSEILGPKAIHFFWVQLERPLANGSITHKLFSSQMYWCSSSTYEAMSRDTESQQRVEQLQTCRCYEERFLSSSLRSACSSVLFFSQFTLVIDFFLNRHVQFLKQTHGFQ